MLASTQIKMVKPPDKKPGISNMGRLFCVFVALISIHLTETVLQHSPGQTTSKECWLMWFILKIPNILCVCAKCALQICTSIEFETIPARKVAIIGVSNGQTVFMSPLFQNYFMPIRNKFLPPLQWPKEVKIQNNSKVKLGEQVLWSVRFIEMTTSRCQQLKLNPLSIQINIYCVITNQMPHSPLTWAAVMLGHSLYFSCLPPPTTLSPDTCLLGTYETKMVVHTGKCSILRILRKNRELWAVYVISKSSVNLQALINDLLFNSFTVHTICADF